MNYEEFVELGEAYHDRGLEIFAFPCNQFGSQEPGEPEQIKAFVGKYGAKLNLMGKVEVNGANTHPLYKVLKKGGRDIKWNFHTKFLVSCDETWCKIQRFDNANPKALIPPIELLLQENVGPQRGALYGLIACVALVGLSMMCINMNKSAQKGSRGPSRKKKTR